MDTSARLVGLQTSSEFISFLLGQSQEMTYEIGRKALERRNKYELK
jgi:hypothetical protein